MVGTLESAGHAAAPGRTCRLSQASLPSFRSAESYAGRASGSGERTGIGAMLAIETGPPKASVTRHSRSKPMQELEQQRTRTLRRARPGPATDDEQPVAIRRGTPGPRSTARVAWMSAGAGLGAVLGPALASSLAGRP